MHMPIVASFLVASSCSCVRHLQVQPGHPAHGQTLITAHGPPFDVDAVMDLLDNDSKGKLKFKGTTQKERFANAMLFMEFLTSTTDETATKFGLCPLYQCNPHFRLFTYFLNQGDALTLLATMLHISTMSALLQATAGYWLC